MTKQRSQLKILLLQIRDDQFTCQEELNEFVRFSRLDVDQFGILNTFETPEFEPTRIEGYDALFVGGSSDASVTQPEKYPFVEDAKRLLVYCLKKKFRYLRLVLAFKRR